MCRDTRETNIAVTIYCCKKTIVKARALYKHGAHSNVDTTAALSIRQRPTCSASCIARLQFLRWGSIRFSSRVRLVVPSSDHQVSTRCPRNCCTVHVYTPRMWGQTVCRMHILAGKSRTFNPESGCTKDLCSANSYIVPYIDECLGS